MTADEIVFEKIKQGCPSLDVREECKLQVVGVSMLYLNRQWCDPEKCPLLHLYKVIQEEYNARR